MLLVRTYVGPSTVHGTGLFAAEPIPKGTIVWRFDPGFDRVYDATDIATFPALTKEFLATYCYRSRYSGRYVFCTDHARHMNHSSAPNCAETRLPGDPESCTIAARDIAAGEELTEDYSSFEDATDPDNVLLAISRTMADLRDPRLK